MSLSIFQGEIVTSLPDEPGYGLDATWPGGQTSAQVIFDILAYYECTETNTDSTGARSMWFHRDDNVWVQINLLPDGRLTLELGEPGV
jgi:hypothetical protein